MSLSVLAACGGGGDGTVADAALADAAIPDTVLVDAAPDAAMTYPALGVYVINLDGTGLTLLTDAGEEVKRVLGAFGYSENRTYLHRDDTYLPARTQERASWNYRMEGCRSSDDRTRVSYWMNRLQGHPESDPLVVTLNPHDGAVPGSVIAIAAHLPP